MLPELTMLWLREKDRFNLSKPCKMTQSSLTCINEMLCCRVRLRLHVSFPEQVEHPLEPVVVCLDLRRPHGSRLYCIDLRSLAWRELSLDLMVPQPLILLLRDLRYA